jgi:hypothetical protein
LFFTTGFGIILKSFLRQDYLLGSALTKHMANIDIGYTAEEIDALLKSGKLERLGMGSRRACYRLPGVGLCVKCYRSDDEIAEGKHPGLQPFKPLSPSVVKEIRRCRFDEKRNTCCQEHEYWKELHRTLTKDLMDMFPATMEKLLLPSRGWCVVEELIENADGSPPAKLYWEFTLAPPAARPAIAAAFDRIAEKILSSAVRIYDPQNLLLQKNSDDTFRIRIADFEPSARTIVSPDRFPYIVRMKLRRRFARYRKMFGIHTSLSEEK